MILAKYSLFASMKKVLVAIAACLLLNSYFAAA